MMQMLHSMVTDGLVSHTGGLLTLMLLVANLTNTKLCLKLEK